MSMITRALSPLSRAKNEAPEVHDDAPQVVHTPTLGYMPALDGIRAIAVIGVLIFHSAVPWMPGGFLGVDVFFVLSGFLITSLLLTEVEATGRIDFKRFYIRRTRRLLPALLAVLVVTAVLVLVLAQDAGSKFREDSIASLFYVLNWWNIVGDQSYFEAIGRPPLLQHLWSLGIEEQFYVLWPAILLFAFRRNGRAAVRRFALIGAIGSTLIMLVLSFVWAMPTENDPSRLYFGTDTHAMTILAGAALATVWRPKALPRFLAAIPKLVLSAIGAASLLVIAWCFLNVTEDSAFMYRGGFLLFAAACAVLIAVSTHPAITASKALAVAPLVYIGRRSYGLYLWHWPIFMVTRPGIDIGWTGIPSLIFQLALTFLAAELSYRYLEMPVRNGAIGRIWNEWHDLGPGVAMKRAVAILGATTITVVGLAWGVSALPAPSADDYLDGATSVGAAELPSTPTITEPSPSPSLPSETGAAGNGTMPELSSAPITAIGDSVMLGSRKYLQSGLPNSTVDAAVSRQANEVYQRIKERREAGQLEPTVIIHTGTNGPASEPELRAALEGLADRERVVLVTANLPRSWVDESNDVIRSVGASFPNVRIADWAATSEGQKDYFVYDGVHLSESGGIAYVNTIGTALNAP